MKRIDLVEYQKALEAAMSKTAEGLSMMELADAWGVALERARMRAQLLVKSGDLRHNGFRREMRIDGIGKNVPVYILTKSK